MWKSRVRCWGANFSGELGFGRTDGGWSIIGDDETPGDVGDVPVMASVTQVSIGDSAICVRLGTSAKCWGSGAAYLGYGDTRSRGALEPASAVPTLSIGSPITHIERGGEHTCVLSSDGRVKCWGTIVRGGLGYPGTAVATTPASVGAIDLGGTATRLETGYGHVCALLNGGGVRCWGNGDGGKLGYGDALAVGDDENPGSRGNVPIL